MRAISTFDQTFSEPIKRQASHSTVRSTGMSQDKILLYTQVPLTRGGARGAAEGLQLPRQGTLVPPLGEIEQFVGK